MKNLKCKVLALTMGASVFIGGKAFAQVPSYVPTNGLVGWWPFNGNANDESGNGNNGTVNGATLTTDRFGNSNKAYSFDGINDYIEVLNNSTLQNVQSFSISIWYKINQWQISGGNSFFATIEKPNSYSLELVRINNDSALCLLIPFKHNENLWNNLTITFSNNIERLYINGIWMKTINNNISASQQSLFFGKDPGGLTEFTNGKLDDIAIWNRPLSQQEITALYKGCGNEITSQPTNASLSAGTDAQFSVGAKSGSSYQWQSNPLNLGWHNISNNSTYSGATSNKLTISSTSVSSHNQPFRAIVNSSGCIDTSTVAKIIIGDTCLTTVTETLIINTKLSLPAPNNENTILIYPNPASDHITIDNGNFAAMAGYTIKIENNAGQQVFQSAINQQQFYVDLSTWSGNGLYFVHLIDPKNKTVTVRKIVLQ